MREKNERGAIMIESTYCILLATVVLMFLLSFGFFLYQKTMVTIIANEVAHDVSQIYKLRDVSDASNVNESDISGIGKYRYFFFKESFDKKNEIRATTFAELRLIETALADGEGGIKVSIDVIVDDIGRRHYEVKVRQTYAFLFGDLLSVIGQKEIQTIEVVSYATGIDVLNYVNTIKVTKYGIDTVTEKSSLLGTINSAIELLHSIFDN